MSPHFGDIGEDSLVILVVKVVLQGGGEGGL